jgi:hypothetical protein
MSKRNSGSGGSSGAFAGRMTLTTEPAFNGVSVTKYEVFELEPIASSVVAPTRDVRTRDNRSSRQSAIDEGVRCDDRYIIGTEASRAGPLEEPQAASRTTGASRRSRFIVGSSASAVMRGNLGRGQNVAQYTLVRDEAVVSSHDA